MSNGPQWDEGSKGWRWWDGQRWVVLAPVKPDSGVKSALAGIGVLALIGLAIQLVLMATR